MGAKKTPNRRTAWGYTFDWTELHQTAEELRPQIFSYDVLASECLKRFDNFPADTSNLKPLKTLRRDPGETSFADAEPSKHRDLYALLQHHADEDEKLQKLWLQVNNIPEWVNWEQLERGQKVFYRYAGPMVVALTFQSLLGGMGGRRVVETLGRTGGFGVKVVRRRLLETYHYLLDVTRDIQSIKPGGDGFASSIRVRFLHAAVRRRILALVKEHEDYYDVEEFGIPINDLDSIGTVSTFCATIIWIGFPRQGIYLRKQEIADCVALWRYLAYLLGTPTDHFSSPAKAKAIMESLLLTEVDPTDRSRMLAANILFGLEGQPPAYPSLDFLRAETHWLNGDELSLALCVGRPPLFHTALVFGQCLFFMFMCYLNRSVPSWDDARINTARRLLHKWTHAQLDHDTVYHEFKYVPNFDHVTVEAGRSGFSGLRHQGVEWRNLKALLISLAVAWAVVWLAWRAIVRLL